MNAEEAKLKAYQVNTDASNSQYADILKLIERFATGGYYTCTYSAVVKDDVRKKLTEDGFNVSKTQDDRNEYYTDISWK
jgi:hypothetical protein